MGLVPAADVPPHQVLGQSRIVGRDEEASQLVVAGSLETLTIAEIVEIEGQRLPNFQESQKSFRMGTVVISAAPLTPEQLTYYDRQTAYFGSQAEDGLAFAAATGFRASMDTRLDPMVTAVLINLDATATTPSSNALSQNYPNPFNSTTTFRFELDGSSPARLEIFALNGQRVRRLEIDQGFEASVRLPGMAATKRNALLPPEPTLSSCGLGLSRRRRKSRSSGSFWCERRCTPRQISGTRIVEPVKIDDCVARLTVAAPVQADIGAGKSAR